MLNFDCIPFDKLTLEELYTCLALRQAVFVVEQNCPYLDADGKDQAAHHLLGRNAQGALIAYARLLPPGLSYPDFASFGRVVTHPDHRGRGLGRILMEEVLQQMRLLYKEAPIKISAQTYLVKFYESLDFRTTGPEYLEDDIPHIAMVRG